MDGMKALPLLFLACNEEYTWGEKKAKNIPF